MKNLFAGLLAIVAISFFSTSCDETTTETIIDTVNVATCTGSECYTVKVSSNITANTTWSSDSIYVLTTRIAVVGAELTIEPGTIIKGGAGTGTNACALVIAKDASINAAGTASAPIIFTSVADNIDLGETTSPNLTDDINGLWGGLIVLGNAHISADNASEQIEGIPATDANGLYGGTEDADNSGTIQYVSVRYGGANIGEGNEINGITFGGVGSGTTVDHVEIVANQDDGMEFFGGTVNVSYALVWSNGDDALDTDQAYAGTIDNFIVINPGDEAMELDGPEGSYEGAGHTIKNGTVYLEGASGMIDLDKNTDVNIMSVHFIPSLPSQDVEEYDVYSAQTGFASSAWTFDASGTYDDDDDSDTPEVALPTDAANYFKNGADAIVTAATTGFATESEYAWTLAKAEGAF
jgi:hypothetical protein